jgi:protein involved in polysaccharide export with SLBB domain
MAVQRSKKRRALHEIPEILQLLENEDISREDAHRRLARLKEEPTSDEVSASRSHSVENLPQSLPRAIVVVPRVTLTVKETPLARVEGRQLQPTKSVAPPILEAQFTRQSVKSRNQTLFIAVCAAVGLTLIVLSFAVFALFPGAESLKSFEEAAPPVLLAGNVGNTGGGGNQPPSVGSPSGFSGEPPVGASQLGVPAAIPPDREADEPRGQQLSLPAVEIQRGQARLNAENQLHGERLPLPDINALKSRMKPRQLSLAATEQTTPTERTDSAEFYTRALTPPAQPSGAADASAREKVQARYPELYRPSSGSTMLKTDDEYKVGVNDELEVTRFHENDTLVTQHVVRENGAINYQFVGEIQVLGLPTRQISSFLQQKLERFLINHTIDVRVFRYNSQFVRASGEIRERIDREYSGPGFHPLRRGRTTLSEFILDIGDTTAVADRSAIELIHPNGDKEIVDLDKVLRKETTDPVVQHGDAIRVPSKRGTRNFVSVTGDVSEPGIYDWQSGMTASEALLRAKNPSQPPALSNVMVISADGSKVPFDYEAFMQRQDRALDIQLKPNDMLFVDAQTPPAAKIIGEVRTEGTYPLGDETHTLMAFVLNRADGWTDQADISRIEVFRRGEGRHVYNLKELIGAPYSKRDLELKDGDFIVIPSVEDLKNKIWVLGNVTNPGVYFLDDTETHLLDAIRLAGGHTKSANLENVRLKRGGLKTAEQIINVSRAMKTGNLADNPLLQPNDVIYVPTSFGSTIGDLASNVLPLIQIATFAQILRNRR